jgi:RecG-like helicase
VYGPWQFGPRGPEIRVEDHELVTDDVSPHRNRWVPVYDLTEGVDGRWLRGLVWSVRGAVGGVPDPLPESVRTQHDLVPLSRALDDFHFPTDLGGPRPGPAPVGL